MVDEQIPWRDSTSCSPLGPLDGGILVWGFWMVCNGRTTLVATTIGDSPHVAVMLPRMLSTSSLAASRYRLLVASHGLSKRGKGPKALRSGVSVVGDDACCVCAAGDCTFLLGDHGTLVRRTCMHCRSIGLPCRGGGWRGRMA